MDDPFIDRFARHLGTFQSRRTLLRNAGKGTAAGAGGVLGLHRFTADSLVAAAAIAEQATPVPYTRPSVHSSAANLDAFADGVRQMKLLPATDPRSWIYQANIHRTRDTPVLPLWNTCQHHTDFFWAWHRMELYWFEQIVRELSGDSTFALPYWDYADPAQQYLPAPFRDPTNPLFESQRRPSVNARDETSPPISHPMFDYCIGLAQGNFGTWTGVSGTLPPNPGAHLTLETQVHDPIHGWIGGDTGLMTFQTTSARDPVFWLHHTNMDRLWSSWRAITLDGANHTDPTDPAWTGTEYEFFNDMGVKIAPPWPVKSILETTAANLGYVYEGLADNAWFTSHCPASFRPLPGPSVVLPPGTPAAEATPVVIEEIGVNAPEGGIEVGAGSVDVPVVLSQQDFAGGPEATPAALPEGSLVLTVDGVESTGVGGVSVDIYINLPPGQTPDFNSPYYVGSIGTFGLLPDDQLDEHAAHGGTTRVFDISRNVAALEDSGEWTGELVVTFVGSDLEFPSTSAAATPEAIAATPEASGSWFTIRRVAVSTR
jgi:hypothetical protein